jgi:hypothetical protein
VSFRPRSITTAILVVAVAVGASACSEEKLTPEEARRERVEERLKLSYTDEQVECMLDQFSDDLLIALDGEGKMPQTGSELDQFTTVTRGCIIESGDTLPGTPDTPATTTSAADPGDTPEDPPEGSDTSSSSPDTTEASSTTEATAAGGGPETRPESEGVQGGQAG